MRIVRKLTADDDRVIVVRYLKGDSGLSLSREFGVQHAAIYRALKRGGIERRRRGWGSGPGDQRRCRLCEETKPVGAFGRIVTRDPKSAASRMYECRDCLARQHREKGWSLRNNTGITLEQYQALLETQGGGCAICGAPPKRVRLCVDHDHATEMIRGLLCHRCNTRMQAIDDDDWVNQATAYRVRPHTGIPFRKRTTS